MSTMDSTHPDMAIMSGLQSARSCAEFCEAAEDEMVTTLLSPEALVHYLPWLIYRDIAADMELVDSLTYRIVPDPRIQSTTPEAMKEQLSPLMDAPRSELLQAYVEYGLSRQNPWGFDRDILQYAASNRWW